MTNVNNLPSLDIEVGIYGYRHGQSVVLSDVIIEVLIIAALPIMI